MPEIAFLVGDVRHARNDNHVSLPRAYETAGWGVSRVLQEAVCLAAGRVRLGRLEPERFDLIWLLGMGRADTFFDRMQLLRLLPQERFVTPVDALVYLHAKYAWTRHMPETHASNDPAYLKAVLQRGGEWVAKPAAGSYGRDVVRLRGDAAGEAAINRLTGAGRGLYCLLQRFVPEIEHGEKRTLLAGGRVIGSYLRLPGKDFRTNLAVDATPRPTQLTPEEQRLVEAVAADLIRHGVGFAAVDVAYPFLMEVNLANPGGLATLAELYGNDFGPAVVSAISLDRGIQ